MRIWSSCRTGSLGIVCITPLRYSVWLGFWPFWFSLHVSCEISLLSVLAWYNIPTMHGIELWVNFKAAFKISKTFFIWESRGINKLSSMSSFIPNLRCALKREKKKIDFFSSLCLSHLSAFDCLQLRSQTVQQHRTLIW